MLGKSEPVFNATILSAFVSAILAVLIAFHVTVTDAQVTSILGVAAVVGAVFFGGNMVARNTVYSPASVKALTGEDNPVVPAVPPPGATVVLQDEPVDRSARFHDGT